MAEVPSRAPRFSLLDGVEADFTYASAAEEAHLRDYWKIIVKRRRIVLLVFFVVLAIGSYFSLTATRLYTAVATLKIEPQNPSVTGLTEMFQSSIGGSSAYDYYLTQFALLESRALAAKVISELGLKTDPDFTDIRIVSSDAIGRLHSATLGYLGKTINRISNLFRTSAKPPKKPATSPAAQPQTDIPADIPSNLVGTYLRLLKVAPVRRTRLVEVVFSTPDPSLAQKLANTHATAFIRMTLETRFGLTNEARDFLGKKLLELKTKVEHTEENLNRFRRTHGVVSMEKGENIIVDQLIDINKQLTKAKADRIEAESLHNIVANKKYHDLSDLIKQGLIPQMRANVAQLEGEKARVSILLKPDHPRVQELGQQINDARRALNNEIANMIRVVESNYAAARAREDALEAEARKQQQKALNLKELAVEYTVLSEDVTVNRSLYDGVLKRLHEISVSNDLSASNIQVVARAERPNGPSSPNTGLSIMLAMALGLFLGVGSAFAFEYMDSKIPTPSRVWHAVALSTFGVVPDISSLNRCFLTGNLRPRRLFQPFTRVALKPPEPNRFAKDLIISHHPLSILSESYRTIRTALLFSQAEKPPQVILLTSPSAGEGKTVTALNLGIALAQDGHHVLLIDADLRKGCCHDRLGIRNHRGLSNVLTGQLSLDEAIQPTYVGGLSLFSRGTCPPNPSDLLGSAKMREILKSVRASFNFILIDSPPVVAVSDAAVLAVNCDGVLLVFDRKKTTTASARGAMGRLNFVRAPVLGVVLNRIDLRDPEYDYYRYYYGADYSSGGESEKGAGKIIEAAAHEEVAEAWLDGLGPGTVPQEFFEHMTSKLTEAAGPMAPLIIRDHIAMLGESREAFSKSRLKELVDLVGEEILNENQRSIFKQKMQEVIRALGVNPIRGEQG